MREYFASKHVPYTLLARARRLVARKVWGRGHHSASHRLKVRRSSRLIMPAVALAAACQLGDRDPNSTESFSNTPAMRDSADIRIVEHRSLAGVDSTSWSLALERKVRFGASDESSNGLIGLAVNAGFLSDGRIVVADGIAQQIHVFSSEGEPLASWGGAGEGPAEFRQLTDLFVLAGDSLLALDRHRFWRIFSPDGELAASGWLGLADVNSPQVKGVFRNGRLLVRSANPPPAETQLDIGVLTERFVRHVAIDRSGRTAADFGVFPERSWLQLDGRSVGGRYRTVALHPGPLLKSINNSLYWANPTLSEVRVYRSDGNLQLVVRLVEGLARSDNDPLYSRLAPEIELDPAVSDALKALRGPDGIGPFSDFTVDELGNVWLREQTDITDDPTFPARWYVFDTEGRLYRQVRLPYRWGSLMNGILISADFILALERDSSMVDSFVLVPLLKEETRPP